MKSLVSRAVVAVSLRGGDSNVKEEEGINSSTQEARESAFEVVKVNEGKSSLED